MAKFKKQTKKKVNDEDKLSSVDSTINFIKALPHAIVFVMILNGLALASFVVPTGSMEDEVMTGDFLFVNRFKYGATTPQIIPLLNIPLPYYKFPGFWEPEVGDVIVFVYPGHLGQIKADPFNYYLKRCMAVAGDEFKVVNGDIYVNGELVPEPEKVKYGFDGINHTPTRFPINKEFTYDNYGPITIPKIGDVIEITPNNFDAWKMFITREGHNPVYNQLTREITIDGVKTNKYTVERDYCFGIGDNRDYSDDSRNWGFIPYENVVGTPMVVYWHWNTGIPFSKLGAKIISSDLTRIGTIID